MSKVCKITGKRHMVGHKVSHSNIKTKHRFDVNLQNRRLWLPKEKRFVRIKLSAKAIRIIDKLGIEMVLKKLVD